MTSAFENLFLPGGDDFTTLDSGMAGLDFYNTTNHNFTSINEMPYVDDNTVSPQLLLRDLSAPGSSNFPLINTPESSYFESPAIASSSAFNTTPLDDGELDGTLDFVQLQRLDPLFPQDGSDQFAQTLPMDANMSFGFSPSVAKASPMVRQKSSPGRPPTSGSAHSRKLSLTSGIVKPSNKARKPLPEISFDDEDDKETQKRKKNTAAARKSRQRKQETQEMLESEIQRLRVMVEVLGGNPDEGRE